MAEVPGPPVEASPDPPAPAPPRRGWLVEALSGAAIALLIAAGTWVLAYVAAEIAGLLMFALLLEGLFHESGPGTAAAPLLEHAEAWIRGLFRLEVLVTLIALVLRRFLIRPSRRGAAWISLAVGLPVAVAVGPVGFEQWQAKREREAERRAEREAAERDSAEQVAQAARAAAKREATARAAEIEAELAEDDRRRRAQAACQEGCFAACRPQRLESACLAACSARCADGGAP